MKRYLYIIFIYVSFRTYFQLQFGEKLYKYMIENIQRLEDFKIEIEAYIMVQLNSTLANYIHRINGLIFFILH
jgi:hypothetical protein